MKHRQLWLTIPIVLLLTTACNTPTQENQTTNPANQTATNKASTRTVVTHSYVTASTYQSAAQNVVYPQLNGLPDASVQSKLNALLKKTAIYVPTKNYTKPGSYTYSCTYNVVYEQGTIMNIVYSSVFTPTGAVHGMPAHTSLIVNLKTGQTYSLNDAFQMNSDYLQKISQVVKSQDQNHVLNTFKPFTGVTRNDTMFLREGGFVVDFSPYEWASFAQGFLDYYVPFSSVKDVVNTKSALWTTLHDSTGFTATNYRSAESAKISALGYAASLRPADETTVLTPKGKTLTAWVANQKKTNPTASGTSVFFFLNGKYLGTDTSHSHGAVENMYPDGQGTIAVTYYNYSSTGDSKPFTIHYDWNGKKLIAMGSFPSGFGSR